MKSSIELLGKVMDRRKIAILGDMLELGEKEKDYHKEVGTFLGETSVNELYCVGPLSECIIEGAKEGFSTAVRIIPFLVAILVLLVVAAIMGGYVFYQRRDT